MTDNQETADVALSDVEAELCRLPDVAAARIVTDHRAVRSRSMSSATRGSSQSRSCATCSRSRSTSFGLELDRRIISVVQLSPDGDESAPTSSQATNARLLVTALESSVTGVRAHRFA